MARIARRPAVTVCALLAALGVVAAIQNVAARGRMDIVFLDVGNANAAYVDVGGRFNLVFDAGGMARFGYGSVQPRAPETTAVPSAEASGAGSGERRLCDYLIARGVRRIDAAVVSHGDADHIEGFYEIIDSLNVERLLIPEAGLGVDSGDLSALADYAAARGVMVEACAKGDVYEFGGGGARLEILSPPRGAERAGEWLPKPTDNDLSLVAAMSFGASRALFCGDISDAAERQLVADGAPLAAQLISVPHHGSKYSSAAAFLKAVSPTTAVAGVGRNNYGHPTAEAISRYVDVGAEFFRTDEDGTVTARFGFDGALRVECYNDLSNQYIFIRADARRKRIREN